MIGDDNDVDAVVEFCFDSIHQIFNITIETNELKTEKRRFETSENWGKHFERTVSCICGESGP